MLPSPFCRPIGQTGSTRGSCVAQSGRKCPWPPCTTPAGTRVSAVQSRASAHCQRALPRTGTEGYARPSFGPRRSTSVRHLGHAHLCTSSRFLAAQRPDTPRGWPPLFFGSKCGADPLYGFNPSTDTSSATAERVCGSDVRVRQLLLPAPRDRGRHRVDTLLLKRRVYGRIDIVG